MIGCFIEAWPQTLSKEVQTKNIKPNIIPSISISNANVEYVHLSYQWYLISLLKNQTVNIDAQCRQKNLTIMGQPLPFMCWGWLLYWGRVWGELRYWKDFGTRRQEKWLDDKLVFKRFWCTCKLGKRCLLRRSVVFFGASATGHWRWPRTIENGTKWCRCGCGGIHFGYGACTGGLLLQWEW